VRIPCINWKYQTGNKQKCTSSSTRRAHCQSQHAAIVVARRRSIQGTPGQRPTLRLRVLRKCYSPATFGDLNGGRFIFHVGPHDPTEDRRWRLRMDIEDPAQRRGPGECQKKRSAMREDIPDHVGHGKRPIANTIRVGWPVELSACTSKSILDVLKRSNTKVCTR
jgi:hypothetical protein